MLSIGPHIFSSPYILAPLAGYTDLPFRLLCRSFGAGYCVSEMISCHGLVYRQAKTIEMLASIDEERPVAFQLFGADPAVLAAAAAMTASYQPDLIDINMGCPVKKVTKRGAGAALMGTPMLAREIIAGVRAKVRLPLTVKMRIGKDSNHINAVEFARMAEDEGVSAIIVHGRTWAQGFTGAVNTEMIGAVKQAVSIPVIGNGDVTSIDEADAMMKMTGCDGVMIGRASLGKPWIFASGGHPRTSREIAEVALKHLELMGRLLPKPLSLGYVKNHISRYFRDLPGSSLMRKKIYEASSITALQELLQAPASICHDLS
jgi:tRNA-dihydrouridine synthase B